MELIQQCLFAGYGNEFKGLSLIAAVQSTWCVLGLLRGWWGRMVGPPPPRALRTHSQIACRLKLEPKYFKRRRTSTPPTNDAVECARHYTVTYVGRSSLLSLLDPKQCGINSVHRKVSLCVLNPVLSWTLRVEDESPLLS